MTREGGEDGKEDDGNSVKEDERCRTCFTAKVVVLGRVDPATTLFWPAVSLVSSELGIIGPPFLLIFFNSSIASSSVATADASFSGCGSRPMPSSPPKKPRDDFVHRFKRRPGDGLVVEPTAAVSVGLKSDGPSSWLSGVF